MKMNKRFVATALTVLSLCIVVPSFAKASVSVSVLGGASLNTAAYGSYNGIDYGARDNWSALLGAELTYGVLDLVYLGAFYDHNFLGDFATGGSGDTRFFGAVGRIALGTGSAWFADVKLGASRVYAPNYITSTEFGYGLGLGYRIDVLPLVSLSPRIGYRSLGSGKVPGTGLSIGAGFIDFGALLTLSI